jgi:hypothetical protein
MKPTTAGAEQNARYSSADPGSDCQALTAFSATGVDDLATTTGFHAGAKTVRPFAFEIAGLESTFHDLNHCLTNHFIDHFGWPTCPEKGRQQYCAGARLSTITGQNP